MSRLIGASNPEPFTKTAGFLRGLDGGTHYDGYFYTYRTNSSNQDIITRYGYSHGGFESVNEANLSDEGLTYYDEWVRVLRRHDGKVLYITMDTYGFVPTSLRIEVHLFSETLAHENTLSLDLSERSRPGTGESPVLDENNVLYIKIRENGGAGSEILRIDSDLTLAWKAFDDINFAGVHAQPYPTQSKLIWPSSHRVALVDRAAGSVEGKILDDLGEEDPDYANALHKRTWTILTDGKLAVLFYEGDTSNPTFYVSVFTDGFSRHKKIDVSALGFTANLIGADQPVHLTRDANDNLVLYNGAKIFTLDWNTEQFTDTLTFDQIPDTQDPRYIWPIDSRNWVFFSQFNSNDGVLAANRTTGKTFMDGFFPDFTIDSVVAMSDNYELTELAGSAEDITTLAAPENLASTVNGSDVDHTWDAVADADGYDLYIDSGLGFVKHNSATIATNSYSIANVGGGTFRWYVKTVKGILESNASSTEQYTVASDNQYSLLLNGTDQYANTGYTAVGTDFDNMTLELRFKTISQDAQCIFGAVNDGFSNIIALNLNRDGNNSDVPGKIVFHLRDDDAVQRQMATTNVHSEIYDGNWHHLALTKDAAQNYKMYLDGSEVALSIGPPGSNGDPDNFAAFDRAVLFGANNDRTEINRHFNGLLDEFRLWTDVRTPAEIEQYRQAEISSPDYSLEFPNLKIYYKAVDGSGNTLTDTIGNNNATLQGNVDDNMWSDFSPYITE